MSPTRKPSPAKTVRVSLLKSLNNRTESPDPLSLPGVTDLSPPSQPLLKDETQTELSDRDSERKVRKPRRDIFALSSSSEDEDPTWTPKHFPSRPNRPFPRAPFKPLRSLDTTLSSTQRVRKSTTKGRGKTTSRLVRASPVAQALFPATTLTRAPITRPESDISRCVSDEFKRLDNSTQSRAMQSHIEAMESIEKWLDVTQGDVIRDMNEKRAREEFEGEKMLWPGWAEPLSVYCLVYLAWHIPRQAEKWLSGRWLHRAEHIEAGHQIGTGTYQNLSKAVTPTDAGTSRGGVKIGLFAAITDESFKHVADRIAATFEEIGVKMQMDDDSDSDVQIISWRRIRHDEAPRHLANDVHDAGAYFDFDDSDADDPDGNATLIQRQRCGPS
ncbi:hypothetical protein CSOJ01_15208 [Colletotrichum sojae]|uniref:Uncharacterized protein n=1 Tax=Colletotrichum sojae TaxID=2175907 RepID=A0A8H6INH6_9PEZI|nr:hypothetical protein CSOJ01_15208 [Colletotrichum sojae]